LGLSLRANRYNLLAYLSNTRLSESISIPLEYALFNVHFQVEKKVHSSVIVKLTEDYSKNVPLLRSSSIHFDEISETMVSSIRALQSFGVAITGNKLNGCGMLNSIHRIKEYQHSSKCANEVNSENIHKISEIYFTESKFDSVYFYTLKLTTESNFPFVRIKSYYLSIKNSFCIASLADEIEVMVITSSSSSSVYEVITFNAVAKIQLYHLQWFIDLSGIRITQTVTEVCVEGGDILGYESLETLTQARYDGLSFKYLRYPLQISSFPGNFNYKSLKFSLCHSFSLQASVTVEHFQLILDSDSVMAGLSNISVKKSVTFMGAYVESNEANNKISFIGPSIYIQNNFYTDSLKYISLSDST
jgi:hypothetical protein